MAIIVGVTGNNPLLQGTADVDEIYGNINGTVTFTAGNDRIFGRGGDDLITGDGVTIAPNGKGGNDVIQGGDGDDDIYGDASGILYGIGGNDVLYQNAEISFGYMVGDAETMQSGSRGGNDKLYGEGDLIGDAFDDMINVVCGHDLLSATSARGRSNLVGDSWNDVYGTTVGGNDTLEGSSYNDSLAGESLHSMAGASTGGDDKLWGHGGDDFLLGEAYFLYNTVVGGDDVLRGGAGADFIYGDAEVLYDFAQGGDDRLHSGGGDDVIWGDGELEDDAQGGADKFHFNGNFGDDSVYDFRQEDGDQLVFKGLNQSEISLSLITLVDPNDNLIDSLQVTTLGDESVTLVGFTGSLTVGADILFV